MAAEAPFKCQRVVLKILSAGCADRRAKQTLKEARRLAAEVGFEATFSKAAEPEGRTKGKRGKAVQKYRNPENPAETWSGRGRPPKWVQAALAGGRAMADLQITPAD